MGLAICRSIVDAQRPDLAAAPGEGAGATFLYSSRASIAARRHRVGTWRAGRQQINTATERAGSDHNRWAEAYNSWPRVRCHDGNGRRESRRHRQAPAAKPKGAKQRSSGRENGRLVHRRAGECKPNRVKMNSDRPVVSSVDDDHRVHGSALQPDFVRRTSGGRCLRSWPRNFCNS